ncbi:MAG: GNAT family N-acetyltransferase [Bacteroidales bacterium]
MNQTFSLSLADHFDNELMQLVETIYIDSFPVEERRPFLKLYKLLTDNSFFRMYIIRKNGDAIGFITTWNFDNCVYVEHFALQADKRGGGAGSFALSELSYMNSKPIILEVEHPTTEMAKRRIFFYERAGFKLWPHIPYIQPPYEPHGEPVELILMTKGDLDLTQEAGNIIPLIYREVYQADPDRYMTLLDK